ncbi:hypothetical protein A3L04_07165 [Thermococcus chitonophagus]|uniref:Antitoxin n=1 Tax=Thermococcus chitonophagus TaxID=54262 RepID=A0A161KIY7_9EURY|nr:antitoxin family protein [Thermococcus chitonophagus]ASJ16867.1 hypothetical protein A3L04_07165 [Thermococcus chitonophagus]CUX78348.1 hypothetical protein, conserved, DUF104 family [Thermococcus chitonophagus]
MSKVIEVVYEKGVLKPTKPLNLKEGQKLLIKIYDEDILEFAREIRKKITPEKVKEDPTDYLLRLREEET